MSNPNKKYMGFMVAAMALALSFFSSHGWGAAPTAPVMTLTTSGLNVSISWSTVTEATGYTLLYAPYPYTGPDSIGSVDMGSQTSLSVTLSAGDAYYVAIKAYNSTGSSDYSNIELFVLTTGTSWLDLSDVNAPGEYTLALEEAPTGTVIVALTPDAQVTVSPTTLTFTPSDWNSPRTIEVTAARDNAAEEIHSASIEHTITSGTGTLSLSGMSVLLNDEVEGLNDIERRLPTLAGGSVASFGELLLAVAESGKEALDVVKNNATEALATALQTKLESLFGNTVTVELQGASPPTFKVTFTNAPLGLSERVISGALTIAVDASSNTASLSFQELSIYTSKDDVSSQVAFTGSVTIVGTGDAAPSSITANLTITATRGESSTVASLSGMTIDFTSTGKMSINGNMSIDTSKGTVDVTVTNLVINRDSRYPTSGTISLTMGSTSATVKFLGGDEVNITITTSSFSVSFDWTLPDGLRNYILGRHIHGARGVSWHPDGKLLASVGFDNLLKVWNTSSTRLYWAQHQSDAVLAVAWSPDGKTLATANLDGSVRVSDVSNTNSFKWKKLDDTPATGSETNQLAWSPDGNYLAGAGNDGNLRIWSYDGQRLTLARTLDTSRVGTTLRALSVAWSADGAQVATGSNNGRLLLWNLSAGPSTVQQPLEVTYGNNSANINGVSFLPDGKLVSVDDYKSLTVWSTDGSKVTGGSIQADDAGNMPVVLGFHSLATCWDGIRFATGPDDAYPPVNWQLVNNGQGAFGVELIGYIGIGINGDDTKALAYAPNGGRNRLASASTDGTVRLLPSSCPGR